MEGHDAVEAQQKDGDEFPRNVYLHLSDYENLKELAGATGSTGPGALVACDLQGVGNLARDRDEVRQGQQATCLRRGLGRGGERSETNRIACRFALTSCLDSDTPLP